MTSLNMTRDEAKGMVGQGWSGLIDRFFDHADRLAEEVYILDIKEKWAGLRIYIWGGEESTNRLIMELESESVHVCESCGEPGRIRRGGWMKTLCDSCHTAREERNIH